ncbi:hypothetical protein SAMN05428970_0937 [Agromyces sp. CF514]|uniref:hypothetical protein n=1 Tax=Agromyces sp. CF514 TaxID=1881031 RepID=UPI0008EC02A8|nr:hypothetical protein [Agromyces sp. CF514]SFR70410.1 hypothetical protein SAMN05428970_0937 [Agromyces sp. CF514]
MRRREVVARCALVTAGVFVLAGVATAASAEEQYGGDDIDVSVEIAQIDEPGVLALTVAGGAVDLTESGSTPTVRQFTGTLPTVTVTDTRTAAEIPDDAFWYVLGTATDFQGTAGQPAIPASLLGWAPELIDGGESGLVGAGDPVDGSLDAGPGLVDVELLAMAASSEEIAEEGQWTATADLSLRTPATVAPGSYTSTLTLSLFE